MNCWTHFGITIVSGGGPLQQLQAVIRASYEMFDYRPKESETKLKYFPTIISSYLEGQFVSWKYELEFRAPPMWSASSCSSSPSLPHSSKWPWRPLFSWFHAFSHGSKWLARAIFWKYMPKFCSVFQCQCNVPLRCSFSLAPGGG